MSRLGVNRSGHLLIQTKPKDNFGRVADGFGRVADGFERVADGNRTDR